MFLKGEELRDFSLFLFNIKGTPKVADIIFPFFEFVPKSFLLFLNFTASLCFFILGFFSKLLTKI